ncbi:MAG: alpha/beta hydrolase [Alphaproteobacteria bacterium]|nr:alpha/beta hydrolase [Alphaproteobacteria bacterium]
MTVDLLPHFFFALKDGGRLRYAQFASTLHPCGTVLVVPGAREFIEKKYIECAKPLLEKGFRVVIYEPRGQGLSSRFLDGDMRQRGHIDTFQTHLDDLRAFCSAVVLPGLSKPLIVHGHSLGAHILLRWLAEDRPAKVSGAFLTAPMVALSGMAAHMAGFGLSWASVRLFGSETTYAPMQHDFGGEDLVFANNPLTQDEQRFNVMADYFREHPELATGGVTWGWMLAALSSMNVMQTWPYLSNINVPILTLTGDQDIITPLAEIAPFLNMIPHIYTRIVSGARHDLLNETEPLCAEAWARIDSFLDTIMRSASAPPANDVSAAPFRFAS